MTQLQTPSQGAVLARFKEHYVDLNGFSRRFDAVDAGNSSNQLQTEAAEALKAEFARVNFFLDGKLRACNDILVCLVCNLLASSDIPEDARAVWLHAQEACADRIGQDLVDVETFTHQNACCLEALATQHREKTGETGLQAWVREHVQLALVPKCQLSLSGLTLGLSDAYELLREARTGAKWNDALAGTGRGAAAGGVWRPPQSFRRRITKFWVPLDKMLPLKMSLIKYLPILIFGRDRKHELQDIINDGFVQKADASTLSSIYYDNPATFEVYEGRWRGDDDSQLFRMRWYGDQGSLAATTETFLERKKYHREAPHASKQSIKERLACQHQHVGRLLGGSMSVNELVAWSTASGKVAGDSPQRMEAFASEYLGVLARRQLSEILLVSYRRTALQHDASDDVRISLDSGVRMAPCGAAPSAEAAKLPFAVLELKLKGECPSWLADVLGGTFGLREITHFSKYVAAVDALFPSIARQVQERSGVKSAMAVPVDGHLPGIVGNAASNGVAMGIPEAHPAIPGVNGMLTDHTDAMDTSAVQGGVVAAAGNKRELSQVIGGTSDEPREKRSTAGL